MQEIHADQTNGSKLNLKKKKDQPNHSGMRETASKLTKKVGERERDGVLAEHEASHPPLF